MNNIEKIVGKYPEITLNKRQCCDFELIVNGAFSPLEGFMRQNDYVNCVKNMRLDNGKLWTMPIVLSIDEKTKDKIKHVDYVLLKHETGLPLGIMNISYNDSIYSIDLEFECDNVYGGNDTNHPYVKILHNDFDNGFIFYLGGTIEKFELPPHYDFTEYRLSPEKTKEYFKEI